MNARRYAWLLIGCLMLSAACSSTRDDTLDSSVALLDITPAHTSPTSSPSSAKCHRDYLASLRPEGPPPAPNNLPAGSFMDNIRKRGYLIVGVDQNTKLLGYYNPNRKQFEGFDIDLAHEVAAAIFGADWMDRIHYVALLTDQRMSAVQENKVDIVADAVTITCKRTMQVAFSNIYFMGHERVLVRLDSTAKVPKDLRGKTVCATSGSTAMDNVKKLPEVIPFPVSARTDCLVALQRGNVDGILTDDAILYGFLAQDPHTRLLDGNITNEPYGLAIAKNHPEFVRFVNAILEQMRSNGRWTQIWKRWFGSVQIGGRPAKPPSQPSPNYKNETG